MCLCTRRQRTVESLTRDRTSCIENTAATCWHLLLIYVVGIILRASACIYLCNLHHSPVRWHYYFPHFMDEDIELAHSPTRMIRVGIWTPESYSGAHRDGGKNQILCFYQVPSSAPWSLPYLQAVKLSNRLLWEGTDPWLYWINQGVDGDKEVCMHAATVCESLLRWDLPLPQTPIASLPEPPLKSLDPAHLSPAQSGLNWLFASVWIGFPKL